MRLHQLSIFLCALITHFHQPGNWSQLLLLYQRSQDKEIWSNQRLHGTRFLQQSMNSTIRWMRFVFSLFGQRAPSVKQLVCWCLATRMNKREDHRKRVKHTFYANDFQGDCVQMFHVTKMLTQTKWDLTQVRLLVFEGDLEIVGRDLPQHT